MCNGHNYYEILNALNKKNENKPLCLIAKTIKGFPVSFMKNQAIWHYRSPNEKEYKIAIKEIDNYLKNEK